MITTCTPHEWTAPDGERFSYSRWDAEAGAEQTPRAVIVAVHGLSGAALDFEPLGHHLAQLGVTTIAPELRGQGNDPRSQRRGDLVAVKEWYDDLSAFLAQSRTTYPGVSFYYYGESMGAALLTRFVAQAETIDLPAGLVLASPVVVVPGKPTWWQKQLFRFTLRLWPTRRVDVGKYAKRDRDVPEKWVTRDEAHRQWFETAPHKLGSFTLRFFNCLFEMIGGCLEAAPHVRVPVLVLYAAHDVFIPAAQVEDFFARLGSKEKELRFFSEAYHLLLHDHDKAQALARIEAWFRERLKLPADSGTSFAK